MFLKHHSLRVTLHRLLNSEHKHEVFRKVKFNYQVFTTKFWIICWNLMVMRFVQLKHIQGGQNVLIVRILFFLVLKLFWLDGFFFKLYGLYGILAWKYTFLPFFLLISTNLHENFQQKKSCQKEVGLTCFLQFK